MNEPVIPLYQVKIGFLITPRFNLSDAHLVHFKYFDECDPIRGSLIAGIAHLTIVEKSPHDNFSDKWLKVSIPGCDPPRILKLSGEEYAMKFSRVD